MSEPKNFPSVTADKFVVRLPDGMREQIAEVAKANNRSMNAEVVARLQDSLEGNAQSDVAYVIKRLQVEMLFLEAKYFRERSLAYRFANALRYVAEHGEIPVWHEPGTEELMSLVYKSVKERKNAYYEGKDVLSALPGAVEELTAIGEAALMSAKKNMPHPDGVFEEAVQSGESDDPVIIAERKRREQDDPEQPASDRSALIKHLAAEPTKKPDHSKAPPKKTTSKK